MHVRRFVVVPHRRRWPLPASNGSERQRVGSRDWRPLNVVGEYVNRLVFGVWPLLLFNIQQIDFGVVETNDSNNNNWSMCRKAYAVTIYIVFERVHTDSCLCGSVTMQINSGFGWYCIWVSDGGIRSGRKPSIFFKIVYLCAEFVCFWCRLERRTEGVSGANVSFIFKTVITCLK